jgi:hypothetical protein
MGHFFDRHHLAVVINWLGSQDLISGTRPKPLFRLPGLSVDILYPLMVSDDWRYGH